MGRVIVACGTAIATSTHIAEKIRNELEKNNLKVDVVQCRISEVENMAREDDVVVATSIVPQEVKAKVFNGVPFLTGVSEDKLMKDILKEIMKGKERV